MVQEGEAPVKRPVFWIRLGFLILLLIAGRHLWLAGGKWLESAREFPWRLDPLLLTASSLLLLIGLFFSPEGWVMVCRERGITLSRRELYAVWFGSQLGRFIPGKVWLFAGRIGLLKARGYSVTKTASTLVLELLFSTAAVGFTALFVGVFHPGIAESHSIRWAIAAAGVAAALLPLLSPLQKIVFRLKKVSFRPVPLGHSLLVTVFYIGTWLVRGTAMWMWFQGMGLDAGPLECMAAAPLSWLAGYIVVLVPGGLGVREAAAALIALPVALLAPGVAAAGGQRIVMTVWEVALAVFTAGALKRTTKESLDEKTG